MDNSIEHTQETQAVSPQERIDKLLAETYPPVQPVGATPVEPMQASIAGASATAGGVTIHLPTIHVGIPKVVKDAYIAITKIPDALLFGMSIIGKVINYSILGVIIGGGFIYSLTLVFSFFAAQYFRGVDQHDWILFLQGIVGVFIALSMYYALRKVK